jgi:hypothetical protein
MFEFLLLQKITDSDKHKKLYYEDYITIEPNDSSSNGGKRQSRKPNTSRKHWKG